jgi:hypothetical protein
MSQSINMITNALEYYDKNMEKYEKIISKFKYYKIIKEQSDLEHNKIIFYDKDKQKIFETAYEILGLYTNVSKTWVWAWTVPQFYKNSTILSKKILNYGLDIPPDTNNKFLKSELVTSRFRISNPIQLDIHVSVASYISKIPFIYNYFYDPTEYDSRDLNKIISKSSVEDVTKGKYASMYLFLLDYKNIKT